MEGLFFVLRTRGQRWDRERATEEQADWAEHSAFMAKLADEGFIALGGPLEGTPNALLLVRAKSEGEVRAKLSEDVWAATDILRIERVAPWNVRWRG